ncbi:MAG: mitochondrial fission ELM1 family protein [Candidatus Omnitrophica bacterium]|nr:mitochondrial fission ELM1 family protein [Candidatus Omnitrophota bacterium]
MKKLIDYICALLVRALNLIFHLLPISFTLWLGGRLGLIACFFNNERRIIAYANLRAAYSREKTPRELKKLTERVYRNIGQIFFEILSLTKVNKKYIDKYIDVVNAEDKYKLTDHPNGVILLTAHFGNWELSGMTSAIKGFPLVVLAREQSMKKLNGLLNRLRESKGLQVVTKGITTRYIVKALHQGKTIGMVGDQDAGKTGTLVEFFGRPASTAPGSARIAQKTGAYIIPAFMARVKGPYHKAILEEAIKIEKKEDITPYLAKYNKLLEKYVRKHPEQYLWLHKRWKSSPLKRVVILSDGKAGHLNQAKALCKQLIRYRKDSGYDVPDTVVKIAEIKYKNKFAKMLLNLCSLFSTHRCQGCMSCMRHCLTSESYENLMKLHADIIISCGSGVAGVNRFFSVENNAKSACVMKPSILRLNKFDMVVLPQHDRVNGKEGSIIVTDTVPNLIDEEYMEKCSRKVSETVKLDAPVKIGILLGGNNSDFELTEEITESLLNNVINASRKLDADILLTTSRRTPRNIEEVVKHRLHSEKRCKFLVIANEKNTPEAVGGILGLSDIVVVSGESVSMVSEAVSSGKAVVVFNLKNKKRKNGKFDRMLRRLEKKGHITTTSVRGLSDAIYGGLRDSEPKPLLRDQYNVYKYMWRLL